MSTPYLSPSAVLTYLRDVNEFYVRYILGCKNRAPQTPAMAVGSCFDAILKARVGEAILGRSYGDVFDALFTSSVDETIRDMVLPYGLHCWTEYKESGAFADLLLELSLAAAEPRMEFEIRESVGVRPNANEAILPVPLLGRPDLYFVMPSGHQVIYDFKVNGYFGSASPKPGYLVCRSKKRESWTRAAYRDCFVGEPVPGIKCNLKMLPQFGTSHQDWVIQLCMYAWILGEPIGTETVFGIEQLTGSGPYGDMRISSFRFQVERSVQIQLRDLIWEIWKRVQNGNWDDKITSNTQEALSDPVFRVISFS